MRWAEMEVGLGISVVTKAEWSLRRERAQDGWEEGRDQECPISPRKGRKAQQEGPLHF